MEGAEHSRYVAKLKAEFDSCDTTATGFLDRDELTKLCHKLQLDAHRTLLMDTLLRGRSYARVNFQEFKDGFVSVLSRSVDVNTSEDDSSYLEPVVPEEVKPKFVKGTKRYGRRSRPDSEPDVALTFDSEDSPPSRTEATDSSPPGVRRAKVRRSTSLESVESLKSDEETGNQKITESDFQCKAYQQQQEEEEPVRGRGGGDHVLTAVCDHLGLQEFNTEDLDSLLQKMDADRVSVRDFQKILCGSTPVSCSTPVRPADLQKAPHRAQVLEDSSARSTSPSLLTASVGQKVLSRLGDGSGWTSPERVIAVWTEEGIRNSRDILQTLDFPLDERLNLTDLTLALDNELLVSGNGIHQAALISYKNEIQHLQVCVEQSCRERDKVRADLDQADQRNLKLVREVDDRHASMETLNQSRIRELEQDFRGRVTCLRSQCEQENEALLQQLERERGILQEELRLQRAQEAELQEELCSATQENSRLEEELCVLMLKLTEAENTVNKLQRDLDQVLHDKFGGLDAAGTPASHEEHFCEIVKDYELQCRELRDRNDELSSELELLKSQRSDRKSRRSAADSASVADDLSWTEQQAVDDESDCDDSDMKRLSSPLVKKKLQPVDQKGLSSLDDVSGPGVSIQTELALEQLKQKHEQELQQLHIQLDTQVNFYERSLELMRQSMEVERKDISQVFKLEISELEENKAHVEQQVQQLKDELDRVQKQLHHGGGGGWSHEQERRMQRERAELEQNFAREIGNLVQRLSAEKDQLEAELKLKMDQEVMVVREESEQQLARMKRHHAEGQRHLLHQLHQERQCLQEQRGFWESRLVQSEQEKLRHEKRRNEEQDHLLGQFSSEKTRLEEQVHSLQDAVQSSALHISQSEASLEECRGRCGQLEDDVRASRGRCLELEARLEEACSQLEESIAFLESHESLSRRLEAEKSELEAELQLVKAREGGLVSQVMQLKEELGNVQATSDSLLQDRALVADNCSRLSDAFVQQQALLQARDHAVGAMRAELEELHHASKSKAAELDSLKTDRARLIQDLKEQAMAVDKLQLQLDSVSEELDRRSVKESLQGVLQQERSRTSQLCRSVEEQEEELCRLRQENVSYARLADQLSTQIVEMETEITTLREHLRDVSAQLNDTADLVPQLRTQINANTRETEQLHTDKEAEAERLRRALRDAQDQQRATEDKFEEEKKKMRQQLMELETLVLALEEAPPPQSPRRMQLEEVRVENSALQERLKVLQQEVQNLEDDVDKKRRKVDELQRERERGREEEERLHRENSRYREEVLDLSGRNLQLSSDNAELSARLHGDQESLRLLGERLATVCKEQGEEGAEVRRLQAAVTQQEREKQQVQGAWTQERHLLEAELSSCWEKLKRVPELEAELSGAALKLQWLNEDKVKVQREADDRNHQVEALQRSVLALESENELIRSQLHAATRDKLGHAQEVTELQRKLEETRNKVEELEGSVRTLLQEKEELCRVMAVQEERVSVTLQEETHRLSVQNQELHHKLSELQVKGQDVQKLTQEQKSLKMQLSELEAARTQAADQAARADATLSLVQAQHARQLQELQELQGRVYSRGGGSHEQEQLEARLLEEQRRSQQLEETLKCQSQQITIKQDQYEKALASLQQRTDGVERKLKAVQTVLQEKVQQLKEQLAKNTKVSAVMQDVYVENSQLMKALQVTEQRQKHAEKKNFLLEEKVGALNRLLRDIVAVALAT
ncbi:ninein-like protein isoform X2 [Solea solea]|uniref:ninein-like protein isoform X2 n=1 Tax=Solea solea TaxID=90069 RepID=UPI00272A02A0|nr:ninein-like protein isoform X2 [Solea solea]